MITSHERIRNACSAFNDGVILDSELASLIVSAVLEGDLKGMDDLACPIPPAIRETMLKSISYIESHDYVDPNPYVRDGLSDQQKRDRAASLMETYKTVFAQFRRYFNADS